MKTLDYLYLNEKNLKEVISALQKLLADFQVHYTNLRGLHWNVKGHGFFTLHEKFESMYNVPENQQAIFAMRLSLL